MSVLVCFNQGEVVNVCNDITIFPGISLHKVELDSWVLPVSNVVEYLLHSNVLIESPPSIEYLNSAISNYNNKLKMKKYDSNGNTPLKYYDTDKINDASDEENAEEELGGNDSEEEEEVDATGANVYCGTVGCSKTYHHSHIGK